MTGYIAAEVIISVLSGGAKVGLKLAGLPGKLGGILGALIEKGRELANKLPSLKKLKGKFKKKDKMPDKPKKGKDSKKEKKEDTPHKKRLGDEALEADAKGIDPQDIATRLNSKKKIIQNATPEELQYIYKNEFVPSGIQDPSAAKLNQRFGGQSGMKFKNDPSGKEFDHITDDLLIEHKFFTTEINSSIGQKVRTEYQVHFLASKTSNRKAYFIFEGNPNPAHVSKIKEYAKRHGVPTTIEENGKIIFKTE